jgi:hypothetical protein
MVIVIFQPFLGNFPELIKIFKDVSVQYILTESAIESLDIGILHGASGFHGNPVFPSSPFEHSDDPRTWVVEVRANHEDLPLF